MTDQVTTQIADTPEVKIRLTPRAKRLLKSVAVGIAATAAVLAVNYVVVKAVAPKDVEETEETEEA